MTLTAMNLQPLAFLSEHEMQNLSTQRSTAPEFSRETYQVLAEDARVLAPGAPISDELMAFAEAIGRLHREWERRELQKGWASPI